MWLKLYFPLAHLPLWDYLCDREANKLSQIERYQNEISRIWTFWLANLDIMISPLGISNHQFKHYSILFRLPIMKDFDGI